MGLLAMAQSRDPGLLSTIADLFTLYCVLPGASIPSHPDNQLPGSYDERAEARLTRQPPDLAASGRWTLLDATPSPDYPPKLWPVWLTDRHHSGVALAPGCRAS